MKFGSLFAGVGGFDLGLEAAGMECVAQCEIDPFCRAVLKKNFPDVRRYEDVTKMKGDDLGDADMIVGGVPCQPASVAGSRKGSNDGRWLWPAFLRIVLERKPVWVLAENVPGLINLEPHGLDWVCGSLEAAGYGVCACVLGADDVGAPHRRKRLFIVAHTAGERRRSRGGESGDANGSGGGRGVVDGGGQALSMADAESRGFGTDGSARRDAGYADERGANLADADGNVRRSQGGVAERRSERGIVVRWPNSPGRPQREWERKRLVKFPVGGAVDGVPVRLARFANRNALRATGNAVVPAVAYAIGKAILKASEHE